MSITLERQMNCYPPMRYIKMIVGRAFATGESKSQIIESAIRKEFDSLPLNEQERYSKLFETLSESERKRPNKI